MPKADQNSSLRVFAFRLKPGQDLKKGIVAFAKTNNIKAGCILTCVGSVKQLHLRFANQSEGTLIKQHFEITSLVGTFSDTTVHLHLTASGSNGKTIGGHLLDETLVYTTAEIVIGKLSSLRFSREKDKMSGYLELIIKSGSIAKKK